jgi:hypothetical protein
MGTAVGPLRQETTGTFGPLATNKVEIPPKLRPSEPYLLGILKRHSA